MLVGSPRSRRQGPRVGILGGTFDPPHIAHLFIAQEALARLGLDRVDFVPAGQPPHKAGRRISAAADRVAMLERAIAGNPGFAVNTIELERAGPSYTVETLARLRERWGGATGIALILGWDMLLDLPRWRQPEQIVAAADEIVAFHRPGYDGDGAALAAVAEALPGLAEKLVKLPVPQLGISASELRSRVASSLPIRYLVPDGVAAYIAAHRLYRAGADAAVGAAPAAGGSRHEQDDRAVGPEARLTCGAPTDADAPEQEARP